MHGAARRRDIIIENGGDRRCVVMDRARWWSSDVQVEKCGVSRFEHLRAVRLMQVLDELIPVGLKFTKIMTEARGDASNVSLGLAIPLRVVSGCRLALYTEDVAHGVPKFGDELSAIIGQDGVWYPIREDPVVQQYGGYVRRCCFRHRGGACEFPTQIGDHGDVIIAILRLRLESKQIDSDVVKWSGRWE